MHKTINLKLRTRFTLLFLLHKKIIIDQLISIFTSYNSIFVSYNIIVTDL